jgi:hypothetical protein
MSYNISLKKMKYATVRRMGNMTYNIWEMVNAACGMTFRDMDGKKAAEVLPILQEVKTKMLAEPEKYKALEPDNGWGSYDGLLNYLYELIRGCEEIPDADFVVE